MVGGDGTIVVKRLLELWLPLRIAWHYSKSESDISQVFEAGDIFICWTAICMPHPVPICCAGFLESLFLAPEIPF